MVRPRMVDRSKVQSATCCIKLTKEQHARWQAMARKQGLTLSAWVRLVLDRAARTG